MVSGTSLVIRESFVFWVGLVLLRSTHDRHDDATSSFQTNTPNTCSTLAQLTPCYSSQFGIGINATLVFYRNLSYKLYDNSRPSKGFEDLEDGMVYLQYCKRKSVNSKVSWTSVLLSYCPICQLSLMLTKISL